MRTRLTDLLGIEHPVMCAGMGGVSYHRLVAAVSEAGGIGTLDELFEAWSWNALGYHAKPFCLLNVGGFWDGLIQFMDHATKSGFLSASRRAQLLVADTPEEALDLLDEAAARATQGMVW